MWFSKICLILGFLLVASIAHGASCLDQTTLQPIVPFVPGCSLTLSWQNNSTPAVPYLGLHVWRKLNSTTYSTTPSATLLPVGGVLPTSFVDTGIVQSGVVNNYTWVVSAFNTGTTGLNQESPVSNEVGFQVPALIIPSPVAPSNATLK